MRTTPARSSKRSNRGMGSAIGTSAHSCLQRNRDGFRPENVSLVQGKALVSEARFPWPGIISSFFPFFPARLNAIYAFKGEGLDRTRPFLKMDKVPYVGSSRPKASASMLESGSRVGSSVWNRFGNRLTITTRMLAFEDYVPIPSGVDQYPPRAGSNFRRWPGWSAITRPSR